MRLETNKHETGFVNRLRRKSLFNCTARLAAARQNFDFNAIRTVDTLRDRNAARARVLASISEKQENRNGRTLFRAR